MMIPPDPMWLWIRQNMSPLQGKAITGGGGLSTPYPMRITQSPQPPRKSQDMDYEKIDYEKMMPLFLRYLQMRGYGR